MDKTKVAVGVFVVVLIGMFLALKFGAKWNLEMSAGLGALPALALAMITFIAMEDREEKKKAAEKQY